MDRNVMMVDDDPAVLFTVRTVLQREGIDVHTASSGKACLDALREGFRGVILMDVMMPELDGWQTVQRMVEEDLLPGNVVCMLTAVVSPGDDMEGLKEYVLDYIRKPFEIKDLVHTVRHCQSVLPAA
jgi:DNA-binding response OmpR family regulator